MNTLQDIMGLMLKKVEDNPDLTIEQIVENMKSKNEITQETYDNIMKAFATLDGFDAKSKELAAAKEEGLTRQDWVADKLEEVTKPLGEDSVKFTRKLTEGLKNLFNNANKLN